MRAFVQHVFAFVTVGLGLVLAGGAAAQPNSAPGGAPEETLEAAAVDALISSAAGATEEADEVTVQGRRSNELGRLRLKMTQSRDKIVDSFNKVNSNDGNDVKCRSERPTGSRLSHNVCRSKAEDAADARAAKGMLDSLLYSAGNYLTPGGGVGPQVNALVGASKSRQGGVAGEEQARAELESELKKMMAQNRELYRAVVEYVEARNDYNDARGQGQVVDTGDTVLR